MEEFHAEVLSLRTSGCSVSRSDRLRCADLLVQSDDRVRQMIYVSEGLRHINGIWERAWGLDMPDLQTPYRTHGGVI